MAEPRPWRRALLAALAAAVVVLLKSVPVVGATPWICAAVDALSLGALLLFTANCSWTAALLGAVLTGALDLAQGTVPWMLPVSLGVGHFLAALVWRRVNRPAVRAVAAALTVFAAQWLLVAAGYVLTKDVSIGGALRTAARSRWYAGAWYAAVLTASALRERRRA